MVHSQRYRFCPGFVALIAWDPEASPEVQAKLAEDNCRWLDRLDAIARRSRLKLVPRAPA